MRDIVGYIEDTLSEIGVISSFQAHPVINGKLPDEYVTFVGYGDTPDLEAGDIEITTSRPVQLNIWSRGNYHNLANSVRSAMKDAGFQRTFEFDVPYTDGDSHFNKVLRFAFFDDYEN